MALRRAAPAVLLALAITLTGCSGDDYVAPAPETATAGADATAASTTLATLEDAVAAGDVQAAAALASDSTAEDLLSAVATNASGIGLTHVTFGYVTETGRTAGEDAWDALVSVTWQVRGFDEAPARVELPVSFADGGRRITAIGGQGARLPLWLAGPVAVRRTADVVVLAAAGDRHIERYTRQGQRAVDHVESTLGGTHRLVVEVPADAAALHRVLDADDDAYASIAAITAPVDGTQAPRSPVHVFLNPGVFDKLDHTAAQVVMTHEAVHATTGASLVQDAPLWLVEGFADYVALRRISLPPSRTSAQIIAQVKKSGLPSALPAASDFNTAATHLGAAYEAAWLVCRTLADKGGERALITFYDDVLAGTEVAPALRRGFGWSEADLLAAWRTRLADLARL